MRDLYQAAVQDGNCIMASEPPLPPPPPLTDTSEAPRHQGWGVGWVRPHRCQADGGVFALRFNRRVLRDAGGN
jgi:hypothetical protein